MDSLIFVLIWSVAASIGILLTIFHLTSMVFYLKFNFEKHQKVINDIESILTCICAEENVSVFFKTMDELNSDDDDKNTEVIGKYYYFSGNNMELAEKCKSTLLKMDELEQKYGERYPELCKRAGVEPYDKDAFTFPRIALAKDYLIDELGYKSYFSTWLHELGHHFAAKECGKEHTEDDANKYARQIIKEKLPYYFRAIYSSHYDIDIDFIDLYIANYSFLKTYLWHKNS